MRSEQPPAPRAPADDLPAPEREVTAEPRPEPAPAKDGHRPALLGRGLRNPALVALLTWALLGPWAAALPRVLNIDPFTQRGATLPLALGGAAAALLACIALRRAGPTLIGICAGVFAAYLVLVLRTALVGTPFPYEGVDGDSGRVSAAVVRYSVSWATSDAIVAGVPAEYPPLFPYVVGKIAMLLDTPAWQLLAPAEIIMISGSVIAGFALWIRLTAPPAALAISALLLPAFGNPAKCYEVVALAVFVPLALLTLARPPGGRLHWLPAGLLTGVLCLTYYAYVVFAAVGLVVLGWWVWRSEPDRRAYLLHLARVTAVVAVVTAWYTIPYLIAMAQGGQQVGDMYQATEISQDPFPFLDLSPFGLVQLAGVIALLWYGRTTWWANPLLLIVAGAYAYRVIGMIRWVATAHTGLFYYTLPLISACLIAAAVLGAWEAVPALLRWARRKDVSLSAGAGVVALTVLLGYTGYSYWYVWMPANRWLATADGGAVPDWNTSNRLAAYAHVQRLPDGRRTLHAQSASKGGARSYLPVADIQGLVYQVRPGDERPRTLSYSEQIFAFLPWRGFIGVDRNASLGPARWVDRHNALLRLATVLDPDAFARASADTGFGPIDVFVLRRDGDSLTWKGLRVPQTVRFGRSQFASASFYVQDLPDGTTVAIRRP
ncbi:hypothetical protein DPM19_03465 [Actinomadura craniellae]|uniref:Arabinofuranosyltransferase AftA N-terminal domain-containing protein n=1 Tax=Actinomadura craniellae TaxID=2231787 RepID=A0A365HDQ7_9ACTN|nr:arabinofuranosyltransferase [Actinomadura craniellae]RAY17217.1 hypothetical protein DPM19_03465 [Actinomadura craniellae]